MKFCLHNRVSPQYLKEADEIAILYRDRNATPDYLEKYPDKTFVLEYPEMLMDEEVENINNWAKFADIKVKLGYYNSTNNLNAPWFMGYPIESYSEANALTEAGAVSIRPGSPMFFRMYDIKNKGYKLRLVPNLCWYSPVPRKDGVCGLWIRPEDLHLYDEYSDDIVVEFETDRPTEEEALYRIYAHEKTWPGPMDMIFKGFNVECENRLIPSDISEIRLNCGHRCQDGGSCHVCTNGVKLRSLLMKQDYKYENGVLTFGEES